MATPCGDVNTPESRGLDFVTHRNSFAAHWSGATSSVFGAWLEVFVEGDVTFDAHLVRSDGALKEVREFLNVL